MSETDEARKAKQKVLAEVMGILFGGTSIDDLHEMRDGLCDVLWWGKGYNEASDSYNPIPLYELDKMVKNLKRLAEYAKGQQ